MNPNAQNLPNNQEAPAAPQPVAPPSPHPISVNQQPATPPQTPVSPPLTPPQPIQSQPIAGQGVMPTETRGGGNGLLIGLVIFIVIVLLASGLAAYWFMLSPQAQARRVSHKFMEYITSKQVDAAIGMSIGDPDDTDDKMFFVSAADGVSGSYALLESTFSGGKGYYLYSLTNEKNKYARTIVVNDGGWKVSSFVWSSQALVLTPREIQDDADAEAVVTTESTAETPGNCLVASDFISLYEEMFGSGNDAMRHDLSKIGTTGNVHFQPDSLEFAVGASEGTIKPYAHFAQRYSDKDFTIEYYGSVGTDSQADIDFAEQRAAKVRDIFIANGAPADKMVMKPARTVLKDLDGSYDDVDQRTSRVVVFKIVPSFACSGQDASL